MDPPSGRPRGRTRPDEVLILTGGLVGRPAFSDRPDRHRPHSRASLTVVSDNGSVSSSHQPASPLLRSGSLSEDTGGSLLHFSTQTTEPLARPTGPPQGGSGGPSCGPWKGWVTRWTHGGDRPFRSSTSRMMASTPPEPPRSRRTTKTIQSGTHVIRASDPSDGVFHLEDVEVGRPIDRLDDVGVSSHVDDVVGGTVLEAVGVIEDRT